MSSSVSNVSALRNVFVRGISNIMKGNPSQISNHFTCERFIVDHLRNFDFIQNEKYNKKKN